MTTDQPSSREKSAFVEPLSFRDDEPVDESVSRYMQNLMARTRGWSDQNAPEAAAVIPTPITPQQEDLTSEAPFDLQFKRDDRSPTAAVETLEIARQPVAIQPVALEPVATQTVETQQPVPFVPSAMDQNASIETENHPTSAVSRPVHQQDKDALRMATENMREVANLQTLKNVEAAGWARLKNSIKTKLGLAAFSFLLCVGLLYLGFRSEPGLIVLGGCAGCIGLLTWIDLFMAIYKLRRRSKELDEQHRKRAS
jgi:hypothetical protein